MSESWLAGVGALADKGSKQASLRQPRRLLPDFLQQQRPHLWHHQHHWKLWHCVLRPGLLGEHSSSAHLCWFLLPLLIAVICTSSLWFVLASMTVICDNIGILLSDKPAE